MTALLPIAVPVIALVTCLVVPYAFMRMLTPSLARGRTMPNYRGRDVYPGLGAVWVIWAGCAIVCGVACASLDERSPLVVLSLMGPLALVAASLGLIDDAYGSADDRGFRGHFRALAAGRMTTGMLKLIGVGAASLVVAAILGQIAPWGRDAHGIAWVGGWLVAAATIALTTNLLNLTDLRPGRALKTYLLVVVPAAPFAVVAMTARAAAGSTGVTLTVISGLSLVIALLGPVMAVWRYDLAERGMLGDAGANAMGAVAGAIIVLGCAVVPLAVIAAGLLALNLISERVSFSAVIERTAPLRWLDSLGRMSGYDMPDEPESLATSPSDVGDSRYHLEDDHDTEEA